MQYIKCPYSICLEKIQKVRIVEPDNPFFVKGNRIHKGAELFVTGKGRAPALPPELVPIKDQLVQLRKRGTEVAVEQEWAFDRAWKPTGWFDKDAWLRMKTDVCGSTVSPPTVDIVDWKTGKVHPEDHKLQRRLYGMGGLILVQEGVLAGGDKNVKLTAQHVYVDTGARATEEFLMKHLAPLKREWLSRTQYMLQDTMFVSKPAPYTCRWCKFNAKRAGGPCKDGI
jgi:RecB family exonuclease